MTLQLEYDFVLPKGYVDEQGKVHKAGSMRMATAMDEILPLRDPRVRANDAYLVVILLSRVITRLGDLTNISPSVIEKLFAADIAYLQDLYRQINDLDVRMLAIICPECGHEFEVEVPPLGES